MFYYFLFSFPFDVKWALKLDHAFAKFLVVYTRNQSKRLGDLIAVACASEKWLVDHYVCGLLATTGLKITWLVRIQPTPGVTGILAKLENHMLGAARSVGTKLPYDYLQSSFSLVVYTGITNDSSKAACYSPNVTSCAIGLKFFDRNICCFSMVKKSAWVST